ncbi:MAG: glycosyl transferase family 1 [Bacteroidetes bacterium]|nr:glycosyl transferase family 1 [Bacteroidota bacterium]
MKKVLILTYYWPPAGGAGVQRCLKFVKYLRNFGWEPIVYTAENGEMPVIDNSLLKDIPQGVEVIKTPIWEPYSVYKKFIGRKKDDKINAAFLSENKKTSLTEKISVWIRGNFFIPDARRFWIRPSIRYLNEYLAKHPVDIIISSGPPHSMHLIARGIKKKYPKLKWLADFRDPWTNIDFYEDLMLTGLADAKHRRQEKSVLEQADHIISVGDTSTKELEDILKLYGPYPSGKFSTITNGYDEEDVYNGPLEKDSKFSMAHIGSLVKSRNPVTLWKALSELTHENPDFKRDLEIKLVGKVDYAVKESIDAFGLSEFVRKIEYLPHSEVIKEQQRSKVLLLLVNKTKNAKSILTGKFFEYMAAKVPIIAIGPKDGDLAKIIHETQAGLISDFEETDVLKQNILATYLGRDTVKPIAEKIESYSRRKLTEKLADTMNRMLQAK